MRPAEAVGFDLAAALPGWIEHAKGAHPEDGPAATVGMPVWAVEELLAVYVGALKAYPAEASRPPCEVTIEGDCPGCVWAFERLQAQGSLQEIVASIRGES